MTNTVAVPFWLFLLILAFAAVTFASHFLFPSVRWFFRRRMEKVVARLNERLERPIQPFKLARRTDMIQRLVYDPGVSEAIVAHAQETGVREDVAFEQAKRYAREIVPSFSATAYFGFAIRASRWLSTQLYDVKVIDRHAEEMARVDPDATIVYVMNHRSNMDYVLVTYLAARQSALSYAVGEWARLWPLSRLIRAMGAYFIRRRSRNDLYRRVLARYVALATQGGVTQAMFPEGGLSLDGALAEPRVGLLKYIVDGWDPERRDVVFVPVALNYDRVLEDTVLIGAHEAGERKFRAPLLDGARFVLKQGLRKVTGRFKRFGVAAVSFGRPMSLTEFMRDHDGHPETLGAELMCRIGATVPLLPVPLVALALSDGAARDRETIYDVLFDALKSNGLADRKFAGMTLQEAVKQGLVVLCARGMLRKTVENTFEMVPKRQAELAFYGNSVAHLLPDFSANLSAIAK